MKKGQLQIRKPAWLQKNVHFFYRFSLFVTWLFFKLFYRLKVYGQEHIVEGRAIIAGNHASYFDPPLVAAAFPEEIHFLARESLFKPILFGRMISALNAHPVRGTASDAAVFKLICRLLEEEKKIILFPEGSRTFDGAFQPLKMGIGLLASRTNSPILPVYIKGSFEAWNRHRKFPRPWGKIICVFGSPIYYETFAHLEKKEAHLALIKHVEEAFYDLKEWLEKGAKGVSP